MYSQLPLKYSFDALEPYIDKATVEIHYSKHHSNYLNNLNNVLLEWKDFDNRPIEYLISHIDEIPERIRQQVINNAGGYYNHNLYWDMMAPGGKKLSAGVLMDLINKKFGSFDLFKESFTKSSLSLFGSGWVWLVLNSSGELEIRLNSFQNNPLMKDPSARLLLCIDVWEHAYYLKYQNRRAEYIENWWNLVDWDYVQSRLN